MICHIPLKLSQIHGTPGAEAVLLLTAPCKETVHNHIKRLSLLTQLRHIHVCHFRYLKMHPFINHGPDQLVKRSCLFKIPVQLHCSDFYDLKRKMLHRIFLSIGTLVPFQIKNNVIHLFILSLYNLNLLTYLIISERIWKGAFNVIDSQYYQSCNCFLRSIAPLMQLAENLYLPAEPFNC